MNSSIWELYNSKNFTNVYSANFPNDTLSPSLINLLPNGKVLSSGGMTWTGSTPLLTASNVCYLYDPNGVSGIESEKTIINNFRLFQNYPNPFNPSTTITYSLPKVSFVKITVYNILGQQVKIFNEGYKRSGTYKIIFNGKNLSSGIYIYTLQTNNLLISKKMLLAK